MSNYVRAQELEVAGYHEPPLGTLFGFPCKCLDQTATFFLSNPALESKSGPLIARTTVHRRPSIFYLRSSLFGPGIESQSHLQFFFTNLKWIIEMKILCYCFLSYFFVHLSIIVVKTATKLISFFLKSFPIISYHSNSFFESSFSFLSEV